MTDHVHCAVCAIALLRNRWTVREWSYLCGGWCADAWVALQTLMGGATHYPGGSEHWVRTRLADGSVANAWVYHEHPAYLSRNG